MVVQDRARAIIIEENRILLIRRDKKAPLIGFFRAEEQKKEKYQSRLLLGNAERN
jgi:hypothetical protein